MYDPPEAQPKRVAVDETAVKINGEWSWLYAAIDLEMKLILDVALFGRHGTDLAAAFLSGLAEKHDLSDAVFLVYQFGYRTTLSRLELSGQVDYADRNLIEKWVHTLKMRVDRFHNSWVGSRQRVGQWLALLQLPQTAPSARRTNAGRGSAKLDSAQRKFPSTFFRKRLQDYAW